MTTEQINSIKAAAEEIAAASKKIVEAVTEPKWPYGKPRENLKAPDGYEFTGEYRMPARGEYFLAARGGTLAIYLDHPELFAPDEFRLILRSKRAEPEWPYNKPREELKAPEGFEFTGEYRTPVNGEFILVTPNGISAMDYSPDSLRPDERRLLKLNPADKCLILRKKPAHPWPYNKPREELKAPEGYEFTGEYRELKLGDLFLGDGSSDYVVECDPSVYFSGERLILRKKPAEPTVESVYGKPLSELKPPDGYAFTGEFRVASAGELLFANWGGRAICYTNPTMGYVLILRKLKRCVFEETGEVRCPKSGEWFSYDGEIHCAKYDWEVTECPIWRRVEA